MHTHHPHPVKANAKREPIDRVMDVVAVVSPMLGVPQVIQIFTSQDASSLSLFSWASFAGVSTIFLLYALKHQLRPLIVTQILWLAVYAAIIPGILIYG
ncbi:MAG TPA: hypothetical protein VM581_03170 [Magnetospirillaceae bacterium]|nr:hypothetical protein [Magnetospirillaceae bacterium]